MTDPTDALQSHPSALALAAALRAVLAAGEESPDALMAVPRMESDGLYAVELRAPRGTGRHRLTAVRHGRSLEEACARSWDSVLDHLDADAKSVGRDLRTFGAGSVNVAVGAHVSAMLRAARDQRVPGAAADRPTVPPPALAPGIIRAAPHAETVRCAPPDRARVAATATLKRLAAEAEERAAHAGLTTEEAWRTSRLLANEGCRGCGRKTMEGSRVCGFCDAKEEGR